VKENSQNIHEVEISKEKFGVFRQGPIKIMFSLSSLTQALSGGPSLPFTIGELSEHNDPSSMWEMHNGQKKDDNSQMTVFVFDCNKHKDKITLAKNAIKRFKTMRHPDILKYIDGAEVKNSVLSA
jgi:SCY1-like protein 1